MDALHQRRLVHGAPGGLRRERQLATRSNHPSTRRAHAGARTQAQTVRVDKSLVIAVTDAVRRAALPQTPRAARRDAGSTQARCSGRTRRVSQARGLAGPEAARVACAQDAPKSSWLHTMQSNTPKPQDAALRRDLDSLLDPEADATDRATKFAQFAVRGAQRMRPAPSGRVDHSAPQESIDDGICRLAAVAIAQNALNVVKARCAPVRGLQPRGAQPDPPPQAVHRSCSSHPGG